MPISLVRSDGVIYPYDDEKFTYCPALITTSEPPGKRARVDNDSYTAASSLSQITPNVSGYFESVDPNLLTVAE